MSPTDMHHICAVISDLVLSTAGIHIESEDCDTAVRVECRRDRCVTIWPPSDMSLLCQRVGGWWAGKGSGCETSLGGL